MIKLFNVSEVASMLGLSTSCVYKKAERGELKAIKIGTALRFHEHDLQSFLEKCRLQTTSTSVQQYYGSWDNSNYQ